MNNKEYQSNLILFRPTTADDLDFVLAAEYADENRPFVNQWSLEEHQNFIQNKDVLHFMIEDATSKQQVGYIMVIGLTNPHRCIKMQRLVITEKGRGYGRAALRLIKRLVFETYKAHRLTLDVREYNERAKKLYFSENFKSDGVLRECVLYNNQFQSIIVMSILEQEYFTDRI